MTTERTIMNALPGPIKPIHYPECDGAPLAENTLQFQWIVTITCGLMAMFRHDGKVFIAGDLFWYPVEGEPKIVQAPDTMVVFGRPNGHRSSYLQWQEGGIAPQVIFEVRSPGNRFGSMLEKFQFYERYGVEEYYLYDPQHNTLEGWMRNGGVLQALPEMKGWKSPRLGVRFELTEKELQLFAPDGKRFLTYEELRQQYEQELREKELAQQRAEKERQEKERERQEKEEAKEHAKRLAAQLRALGIEPEA